MNVAIAGGGIFGQTIAWRLAARRHRAVVIEPIGPGCTGSASGDRSRTVRALYNRRCFTESGLKSLELWSLWSEELGARLTEPTGAIYIEGSDDSAGAASFRVWLEQGVSNLRSLGGEAEEFDAVEACRRWPALSPDDVRRVVLEPGGGFGRPALAARSIARATLATGRVDYMTGAATRVLVRGGAAIGLEAAGENGQLTEVRADAVVIAAGFQGVGLLSPLIDGGDLGIRRVPHWTSYWDTPYPAGADLHMSRLPVWIDLGRELYGFPDDGESGFKAAWHAPTCSPKELHDRQPTADEVLALRTTVAARFPALRAATYCGYYLCAYDATPDEMFQIGAVPGVSGLYFVGGLSGHGFKHAPSLCESVAALVSGEAPLLDLAPYALRTRSVDG